MMEKGYVQVYTGNGKGKTTAALGLSLRAVCAGKRVYIGQFMKGQDYSELKAVAFLNNLQMVQFGNLKFVKGEPTPEDFEGAKKGLAHMKEKLLSGDYDVVVFDEINTTLYFKLLEADEVLDILKQKPEHTEVILTGRYAPEEIIEFADLVTEMKEIKHYYNTQHVMARTGIEN